MSAFLAVAPKMRGLNIVRSVPATLREGDDMINRAAHWISGWKTKVNRLAAQLANVVVAFEDAGAIHGAASWVNVRLALEVSAVVACGARRASLRAISPFGVKNWRKRFPAVSALFGDWRAGQNTFPVFASRKRAVTPLTAVLLPLAGDKQISAISARCTCGGNAESIPCMLCPREAAHSAFLGDLALGCIRALARAVVKAIDGLGLVGYATVLAMRHQRRDWRGFGFYLAAMDTGASRPAALLSAILGFELRAADNACPRAPHCFESEEAGAATHSTHKARLSLCQQRAAHSARHGTQTGRGRRSTTAITTILRLWSARLSLSLLEFCSALRTTHAPIISNATAREQGNACGQWGRALRIAAELCSRDRGRRLVRISVYLVKSPSHARP